MISGKKYSIRKICYNFKEVFVIYVWGDVCVESQKESAWWLTYVKKMTGQGQAGSPRANVADIVTAGVGGFVSISVLLLLTYLTDAEWLMASLGASCVLVFGAWTAPFSQPRNIIGGHLLSGIIALSFSALFGDHPIVISLAVALTMMAMILTKTVHPPAGGNPIIIIMGGYDWSYLVEPLLIGAVVIVIFAVIINNARQNRHYPLFWY